MTDTSIPKGSTPVPDPTILTTQQLNREIAASREIIETRLDAMDTAIVLNKEATDKIPLVIKGNVDHVKELFNERFASIDNQFSERDTRTDKIAELGQKALEAALSAAKEAVGKTELSFTKQIDQIGDMIESKNSALDDKINDLKGRLDRGEGQKVQAVETKGQQNWFIGLFVIGGLTVVSIIISVVAILAK